MTAPRGDLGVGGVAGIGVDAVDVVRFRQVMARRPGIVHRLFTETERAYAARSRDPGPRLAVRFAKTIQPQQTITTRIWDTGDGNYAYETQSDEGAVVIKDGLASVRS